jgi:hypothetical protein
MVPAGPGATFVVIEPELALELAVVELDRPAQPRQPHEFRVWVPAGRFDSQ